MHIKSMVAGAALAFALTVGSAYAADPFATLDGVQAQPMIAAEMDQVRGTAITLALPAGPDPIGPDAAAIVLIATANEPTGRTVPF